MDRFLLVLLPQDIYVYKATDNIAFEVFYLNGEEKFKWKRESCIRDFENLKHEMLDVCNLDNLNQVGLDVIYHNVDTEIVKRISENLLPCAWWQVISFEKLLPELLLRMKKIKPGISFNLIFEGSNYNAHMDENGFIKIIPSNGEAKLIIDVNMFPDAFNSRYEFITNENKIKEKDIEITAITKMNRELTDRVKLLESEIKALNDRLIKKSDELIEKNNVIKKLEKDSSKAYIANRIIVRAEKPESSSSPFGELSPIVSSSIGILSPFHNNASKLKVMWKALNGNLVRSGEVIAMIGQVSSEGIIRSKALYSDTNGRLFTLVNKDEVKEGQILAVISDPGDSIEDIRQWVGNNL